MSDNDRFNYEKLHKELHDVKNGLPKLAGEEPLPYKALTGSFCSFCGKAQIEVAKLIQGPSVYIFDECVITSLAIIKRELNNEK